MTHDTLNSNHTVVGTGLIVVQVWAGGGDSACEDGRDKSGERRSAETGGGEGGNDRNGRKDNDEGGEGKGDYGSNGGNE